MRLLFVFFGAFAAFLSVTKGDEATLNTLLNSFFTALPAALKSREPYTQNFSAIDVPIQIKGTVFPNLYFTCSRLTFTGTSNIISESHSVTYNEAIVMDVTYDATIQNPRLSCAMQGTHVAGDATAQTARPFQGILEISGGTLIRHHTYHVYLGADKQYALAGMTEKAAPDSIGMIAKATVDDTVVQADLDAAAIILLFNAIEKQEAIAQFYASQELFSSLPQPPQ